MTSFDQRERAMENKFAHDKEIEFKVISRRRKLLGLWAAEQMRLDDELALAYALEIVRYGIEDKAEGAVVRRIQGDLTKAGVNLSESDVREKLSELNARAQREVVDLSK